MPVCTYTVKIGSELWLVEQRADGSIWAKPADSQDEPVRYGAW